MGNLLLCPQNREGQELGLPTLGQRTTPLSWPCLPQVFSVRMGVQERKGGSETPGHHPPLAPFYMLLLTLMVAAAAKPAPLQAS